MAQKHGLAIQIHDCRVVQDFDAGLCREVFAYREVSVAVHEVHRYASVGEFAQSGLHRGVVGIGIVVTQPNLKKITQNVECFRTTGFRFQKAEELLTDLGLAGLEMQVGNKQRRHISRRSRATSS